MSAAGRESTRCRPGNPLSIARRRPARQAEWAAAASRRAPCPRLAANTAKRPPPASDRRPPVRAHGPDILVCVASSHRNAGSREETVPRMCKLGRIAFVVVLVGCIAGRAHGGQQPAPSPPDVAALQATIDQLRQQLDALALKVAAL